MEMKYDILIVGGGMVGASLACALAPLSLRVGIIEKYPMLAATDPGFDARSIALAYGSRKIFEGIGLWSHVQDKVSPIHKIHISDRGHFGVTRLDRRQAGVEALGYVIENHALGQGLHQMLDQLGNVSMICPADVQSIETDDNAATVTIMQDGVLHRLQSSLVVAADGSDSMIRQSLSIPAKIREYGQTALICNVACSKPHHQVAYERFTDSGPLAMLPMLDSPGIEEGTGRVSLVWTLQDEQVDEFLSLDDDAFLQRLQQRFGRRLGGLTGLGRRQSYPLRMIQVMDQVQSRVALIGNAAHTLHPVAGQGYNLGVRDVAVLTGVIARACEQDDDIGDIQVLQQYASWRKQDHRQMTAFTDSLVRVFSSPLLPVRLARGMALTLLDILPPAKRILTQQTMGLGKHLAGFPLAARRRA